MTAGAISGSIKAGAAVVEVGASVAEAALAAAVGTGLTAGAAEAEGADSAADSALGSDEGVSVDASSEGSAPGIVSCAGVTAGTSAKGF